jgi:hypothetical protein
VLLLQLPPWSRLTGSAAHHTHRHYHLTHHGSAARCTPAVPAVNIAAAVPVAVLTEIRHSFDT